MHIRCWGSRGSIPVSGPEYVRYGGDTTCVEIRSVNGDLLIIDAGSGIRRLGERIAKDGPNCFTMLFTHAHLDHIMGVPFFPPIYQKGTQITIYGRTFGDIKSYRDILGGIMKTPYCPVELDKVDASLEFRTIEDAPLTIGSLTVTFIPLSHPNGGLGYCIKENGKSFVFLTDNELDYSHPVGLNDTDYIAFSRGADLLIHDAEYMPKDYIVGWGHSVFESAVKLGLSANVKRFGLFHINQRRTDEEMDEMVAQSRAIVKAAGSSMECFGVSNTWELTL